MKKHIGILFMTILLVCSSGTAVIAQKASNPAVKIYKEDMVVKVFIGQPSGSIASNAYKSNRNNVYKELAEQEPNKVMESLVVLNEFVSADQLEKIFSNQSIEAKRIWLAETVVYERKAELGEEDFEVQKDRELYGP